MDAEDTKLYSFDPVKFIIFMAVFYLVPYPIYRYIAHKFKWETNEKTVSRHCRDLFDGFTYGLLLFIFGNYSHTFNWIMIVAFYPSLFIYALIAELPFTRTSLPNIKNWPKGMWVVFIIALLVIFGFAGFHIYLGNLLPKPFVYWYVGCLLIPALILVISFGVSKEVNQNWIRTKLYRRRDEESPLIPPSPYTRPVSIHLHHWQIFYVLAFFTRFDHPVSQVGAGIVLACYMEGVCAYGYDNLVNDG